MKTCPYCAEEIQPDARKCKHCGEWLKEQNDSVEPINKSWQTSKYTGMILAVVIFLIIGWSMINSNENDRGVEIIEDTTNSNISEKLAPVFNVDPSEFRERYQRNWYPDDLKDPTIRKWATAGDRFEFVKGDRDHCLRVVVDSFWDEFNKEEQHELVSVIWGVWMGCELPRGFAGDTPLEVVDQDGKILAKRPVM